MEQHDTIYRPKPMTEAEFARTLDSFEERLGQSKSASTWSNYASVLNQFAAWETAQSGLTCYTLLPLDQRMGFWLEHCLESSKVSVASLVIYYRRLHHVFKLLQGSTSPVLEAYGRALLRDPRSRSDGARALSLEQLAKVLEHVGRMESTTPWAQVLTMYILASRNDDVNRLEWTDVHYSSDEDVVVFRWDKGTKPGPDKRVDCIPNPPDRLRDYLTEFGTDESPSRPFPLTDATITTFLREGLQLADDSPEKDSISSHSLKKTALTQLLLNRVPIFKVQFKAKHSSPTMLQTYVGSDVWAAAHDCLEMSNALTEALRQSESH